MAIFHDRDGNRFTLLPDVERHILSQHPEMERHRHQWEAMLREPDMIVQSLKFRDRRLYYQGYHGKLFFVVVVDMTKMIIKTSFITDRIKKGVFLWKKEMD